MWNVTFWVSKRTLNIAHQKLVWGAWQPDDKGHRSMQNINKELVSGDQNETAILHFLLVTFTMDGVPWTLWCVDMWSLQLMDLRSKTLPDLMCYQLIIHIESSHQINVVTFHPWEKMRQFTPASRWGPFYILFEMRGCISYKTNITKWTQLPYFVTSPRWSSGTYSAEVL